jgi:hypothetical protein
MSRVFILLAAIVSTVIPIVLKVEFLVSIGGSKWQIMGDTLVTFALKVQFVHN